MSYHVTKRNKTALCEAKRRGCPLRHFDTVEEADAFAAERQAEVERVVAGKREEFASWVKVDVDGCVVEDVTAEAQPITDAQLKRLLGKKLEYSDWHPNIKAFSGEVEKLGIKLPGVRSKQFKMLNVLAYHPKYAFSRKHLQAVGDKLGIGDGDIIQSVNKFSQYGFKLTTFRRSGVTYYCLPSIVWNGGVTRAKVKGLSSEAKEVLTANSRSFFSGLVDDDYEVGHKDPRKPLEGDNVVMQPSHINRSYRDNYIFDDRGLPRVPNPEKLSKNFRRFYSEEDARLIYEGLKSEFEPDV